MRMSLLRTAVAIIALYGFTGAGNVYSQPAPVFDLPGETSKINLKDYKGKTILLDFWASWCVPCRQSFSWMNKMQSRYGKDGFKVIAINLDPSQKDAEQFLKKVPADFDIAYDPKGRTADAYKLSVMPSSFLINKNGEIVYKHRGFNGVDKAVLEDKIRKLVGHKQVASK